MPNPRVRPLVALAPALAVLLTATSPAEAQVTAAQVFSDLGRALASVGATFGDVMKTTTYITDVRNLGMLREVRARYFDAARAPANTLIPVTGLARPELLLEIEAVADIRPAAR